MKINHSNIEAYLLDYLEGNLNPMLTAELMVFLTEHPEYEKSMPSLDFLLPVAENAKYADKESLKKNLNDIPEINPRNFEEFCIAYSEKLLQQSDIIRLFRYIGNDPEKHNILHLYSTLKVTPDEQIVYQQKSLLKKPVPFAISKKHLYYALSLAALIVLIFLISIRHNTSNVHPISELTIQESFPANSHTENTQTLKIEKQAASDRSQTLAPVSSASEIQGAIETPVEHNTSARELPAMKSLNPIAINSIPPPDNEFPLSYPVLSPINHKKDQPANSDSEGLISSLIARVDIWKTAKTAIEGFNQLTESQLSISKIYDENGRASMLVSTESYSIESFAKK